MSLFCHSEVRRRISCSEILRFAQACPRAQRRNDNGLKFNREWYNMFIGTLDELAIFNDRALSDKEIENFMTGFGANVSPASKLPTTWGALKKVNGLP